MPDPLATLTDRLYTDYQPGLTHADIARVVHQCRADLDGTPEPALPELLERLARQRLTDQCDAVARAVGAVRPPQPEPPNPRPDPTAPIPDPEPPPITARDPLPAPAPPSPAPDPDPDPRRPEPVAGAW